MVTLYELNEVFDLTDNFFNTIRNRGTLPWDTNKDSGLWLNYLYNHSGDKWVSPAVNKMLTEGELSTANKTALANLISDMYAENWTRLYAAYFADYNPIENYDRLETHTGTETLTDTPDNWTRTNTIGATSETDTETQTPNNWQKTNVTGATSETDTETQTPNGWIEQTLHGATSGVSTETKTPDGWTETKTKESADNERTVNSAIYGFNSATAAPANTEVTTEKYLETVETSGTFETETAKSEQAHTDTVTKLGVYETETVRDADAHTDTETQTGTFETETTRETDAHTDTVTQSGTYETETTRETTQHINSETQTGSYEHETEYNTTIRARGNIGVTTSQQMIESEIELRQKNYYDIVFRDLDRVLTLDIY